jgi:hypothetical protein
VTTPIEALEARFAEIAISMVSWDGIDPDKAHFLLAFARGALEVIKNCAVEQDYPSVGCLVAKEFLERKWE